MPRYAVIDNKANLVIGTVDANDVVEAARKADEAKGLTDRDYKLHGLNTAGRHGPEVLDYYVYETSPDFTLLDDNPAREVAAVRQIPLKAVVEVTTPEAKQERIAQDERLGDEAA